MYGKLVGDEVVPCSIHELGKMYESVAARKIGDTHVGMVEISTVFLGINHARGEGPPLWFETMVFGGKLDGEMDRYSTYADAVAGHVAMVDRVKAAL